MRRFLWMVWMALSVLAASARGLAQAVPPPAPPALPRGVLVEKVACAGHPDQAYALYLPSTYTPDRRWPILYAFDARANGKAVAELFQKAAETYGWILVSSWNTASDGPMEPNFTAMKALWADTHERFAIDETRVYAAGFSGTVRFACILALTAPGSIAGVIGASAGFPMGSPPKKDNPFVFFGTYGDRDFNYYEMNDLDRALAGLAVPHRIEPFAGLHDWPPADLATQAVAWMELQAMKSGKREKSPALIEAEWAADRERARTQAGPSRRRPPHLAGDGRRLRRPARRRRGGARGRGPRRLAGLPEGARASARSGTTATRNCSPARPGSWPAPTPAASR